MPRAPFFNIPNGRLHARDNANAYADKYTSGRLLRLNVHGTGGIRKPSACVHATISATGA